MPSMTDPSDALASFQQLLPTGQLPLQRGAIDPELYVHFDRVNGRSRFTYVRTEKSTVIVMVMLVTDVPLEEKPYFDLGYAVPVSHRGRGLAKEAVVAALAEMANGMARAGATSFFVQAVVGEENAASQHVAAATVSADPTSITDAVSGLPALRYLGEFKTLLKAA